MDSTATFPIRLDRPSRIPMTVLGAGTGLVEITLDRPTRARLGPLGVRMRRLVVSAEDQRGLAAALNPSTPRSPGSGENSS